MRQSGVGLEEGVAVGELVVGLEVGDDVGELVGDDVGLEVGDDVGELVGDEVGFEVGDVVGNVQLIFVASSQSNGLSLCVHVSATHRLRSISVQYGPPSSFKSSPMRHSP